MSQIIAIAVNTFREAVRNKIFFSLVLFSIAMLLLTMAIGSASLNEEVRVMKNVGLFLISTFSVMIGVFVGVNLIYKDIERKTIYTVMPKPIFRFQFLLGKYLGLAMTMIIQVVIMGGIISAQFWMLDAEIGIELFQALWLIYIEVLVVVAIALFFSSFSSPFLSGMLTLGIFVVGRFVDTILTGKLIQADSGDFMRVVATLAKGIAKITPDLSIYDTTAYVVYDNKIAWDYVLQATNYGVSYLAVLLLLASLIFSRRDFV